MVQYATVYILFTAGGAPHTKGALLGRHTLSAEYLFYYRTVLSRGEADLYVHTRNQITQQTLLPSGRTLSSSIGVHPPCLPDVHPPCLPTCRQS